MISNLTLISWLKDIIPCNMGNPWSVNRKSYYFNGISLFYKYKIGPTSKTILWKQFQRKVLFTIPLSIIDDFLCKICIKSCLLLTRMQFFYVGVSDWLLFNVKRTFFFMARTSHFWWDDARLTRLNGSL